MIYLDHAATTPICEEALHAMEDCMKNAWHNPSAAYGAAGNARRRLRIARQTVAKTLGAQTNEIIFTSGGTESNNLALSIARGKHAVIFASEHASVLEAARRIGCRTTIIYPDGDCRAAQDKVMAAVREDTALISVQLANNETGAIQPAAEIGAVARRMRVPFHCDAVQAFGHISVNVRELNVDLLSLSAHKFYGPRGAGALYARQGTLSAPIIAGGGQEFGMRAGTENLPAICGMAAAAEMMTADMEQRAEREAALMAEFSRKLRSLIPECTPLCEDVPRLPGVQAFLLPGLSAERAIAELDLKGIMISGGAACASRDEAASHVYRAMGLSEEMAKCVVRISIGRTTRMDELDSAASALKETYRRHAEPLR